MPSTRCTRCHAVLERGVETCQECGELTPLGMEKERRLRWRATRTGVWNPAFRNPTFLSVLYVIGLILLILIVSVFAYLVNARLI